MTCAAERVTCLTLWRVFKWLYNELCQPSTFWIWGWLLFALSHFKSWWNKSLHCIMRGLIILALLFVSWHCLWRGTSAPNTSRCRLWWLKLVWDGRVLGMCLHDDKKHIWLLQHLTGTFSLFSPKSQTGGGIFELSECLLKSPENCFPNAFGPLVIQLAAAFLTLAWWKEE